MLNATYEAGCDRMVHDSFRGLSGWFSRLSVYRLSKHLLSISMRVPSNTVQRRHSPAPWSSQRSRMMLSDHLCKACMMSVPGRAGILSPLGLHGLCPVFCLIFFHFRWRLLNCAINVDPLAYLEETSLSVVTSLPSFYVTSVQSEGKDPAACLGCWCFFPTCCPATIWQICYSSSSIVISVIGSGAYADVVGGVLSWLQRLQLRLFGKQVLFPVLLSLLGVAFFLRLCWKKK